MILNLIMLILFYTNLKIIPFKLLNSFKLQFLLKHIANFLYFKALFCKFNVNNLKFSIR